MSLWKCLTSSILLALSLAACMPAESAALPTLAPIAVLNAGGQAILTGRSDMPLLPATFTPLAATVAPSPTGTRQPDYQPPTETPLPIPTNTPVTPTSTPFPSPTITSTPTDTPEPTATVSFFDELPVRPLAEYTLEDPLPIVYYPRPADDNGWGIHWIPSLAQDRGVVDRFIVEVKRMNIKWVVFLNESTDTRRNNYLVDQLVANDIMPVMRVYRSNVLPYDGDLPDLVRHFVARGVLYYQLYNEPNVNAENDQGFPNPNHYALQWATAARMVMYNGGYPGIGALSPGGEYNHYTFLDRTLKALIRNGDSVLLNRAWISAHNYNGLRAPDDPDGFFLYRKYNDISRENLRRSLPIIGTEAGSYHAEPEVERQQITWQYEYMEHREPYFFAHSHWVLANLLGGSVDSTWEYQTLFRQGFVHPVVTNFFYQGPSALAPQTGQ